MGEYTSGQYKATIHNEKNVTPEFILAEAKTIWSKVKHEITARGLQPGDIDGARKLAADMQREHKDFCQSYPIVLRYMTEMRVFHPAAMRRYLRKLAVNPWTSVESYLDSQADYAALLYQATNKRWKPSEVQNVRKTIRALLQREHEQFQAYHREFEAEVEYKESKNTQEAKEQLMEVLKKLGGKAPTTCELSGASDSYQTWEPSSDEPAPADVPVTLPFDV